MASPADGHCLMHSILSCLRAKYGTDGLSIEDLLCILKTECYENFNEYMPSFDGDLSSFFHLMYEYVDDIVNDSSFGDLVPIIMCNALNEVIVIIDETDTNGSVTVIPPKTCHSFRGWDPATGIHLFKVSDHYNACVPVPSCESHMPSAHARVRRSRFGTGPTQLASGWSRSDFGASWRACRVNDPATVNHFNVLDPGTDWLNREDTPDITCNNPLTVFLQQTRWYGLSLS